MVAVQVMTDAALFAERLVVSTKAAWGDLVYLTIKAGEENGDLRQVADTIASTLVSWTPSENGQRKTKFLMIRTTADRLLHKMKCIAALVNEGVSAEDIVAMGQHAVISKYQRDRIAREKEKRVEMRSRIPGSLRDVCQEEIRRIREEMGFATSEEFWSWQHSEWTKWTPERLRLEREQLK